METAQKERQLYLPLFASLASRFKAPRVHLGVHCCKCVVWPQSQPALAGKDGKEQELQELLRI